MILEYLIGIICFELIVYLAIKIIYWFDYTNSYIHCHCNFEPCNHNDDGIVAMELSREEGEELLKQLFSDDEE